jgi:hypothetical protein
MRGRTTFEPALTAKVARIDLELLEMALNANIIRAGRRQAYLSENLADGPA